MSLAVELYNSENNLVKMEIPGEDKNNFALNHKMNAGESYKYKIYSYGQSGSFEILLTRSEQHKAGKIELSFPEEVYPVAIPGTLDY